MKLEEQEAVNRYLLNLKKEIGIQIRLLKPATITEAQAHAAVDKRNVDKRKPANTINHA